MSENKIIVCCRLFLDKVDVSNIKEGMKRYAVERSRTQPLKVPTAGSVFKNPPGDFAGRLIEKAGLKGMQVGMAKISEKHANFIENLGGAKASDILALMELVKDRVLRKSGIALELEVRIVGDGVSNRVRVLT